MMQICSDGMVEPISIQYTLWIKIQAYNLVSIAPLACVFVVYFYSPGEIFGYCYVIASFAYTKTKMANFNIKIPIFDALLLAI